MLNFLVFLVLVTGIRGDGLHFDYNTEYASNYDNYKPRDYHFNYAVSDPHTGDHKSQWEVKENGVVRGGYSLLEPDGTTRLVEYIADDHGFRAVVKKIGTAIHSDHYQTHGDVLQPIIAHHRAYDGQIGNYASGYQEHVPLELPAAVQPLEIPAAVHAPEIPAPVYVPEQPLELPAAVHLPEQPLEIPAALKVPHVVPEQPLELPAAVHLPEQPLEIPHVVPEQPLGVPQSLHIQPIPYQLQQPLLYQDHQVYGQIQQPIASGYIGEGKEQYLELKQTVPEAPELVPISPSYQMTVEYHGLTGNLEDDSRYAGEYHGEGSAKVPKVVPAPGQEKFLINLPDRDE